MTKTVRSALFTRAIYAADTRVAQSAENDRFWDGRFVRRGSCEFWLSVAVFCDCSVSLGVVRLLFVAVHFYGIAWLLIPGFIFAVRTVRVTVAEFADNGIRGRR